jgi:hypothetical protein
MFRPGLASSSIHLLPRRPIPFDYWIYLWNGGHLRPTPPLSLYFLMWLKNLSQTREPAVAFANPALGACNGPIGSNCAMILGHRCPIHGKRAKPLDRAAAAAHVDFCVLCVCLWLCFVCGSDFQLSAVGLLAPSQRYNTIEGEEACRLWPEKKCLLEKVIEGVVVVQKRKLWA